MFQPGLVALARHPEVRHRSGGAARSDGHPDGAERLGIGRRPSNDRSPHRVRTSRRRSDDSGRNATEEGENYVAVSQKEARGGLTLFASSSSKPLSQS